MIRFQAETNNMRKFRELALCSQLRNRSLNQSQESGVACPRFEPANLRRSGL